LIQNNQDLKKMPEDTNNQSIINQDFKTITEDTNNQSIGIK